tara:strand:- start:72396 stop:73673 length:1278 start_codon:yes stop_codon:yes gene_type:complete
MLLIASAGLAVAPWLLGIVTQTASTYLHFYAATVLGVTAFGFDSYWFDGPNKKAEYKGSPVSEGAKYGVGVSESRPRLNLSKLVKHAHHLVLAGEYFQGLSGAEKQAILEKDEATNIIQENLADYKPFLLSMDKKNPKFVLMGAGRYEAAGHLIFSAGCFEEKYNLTANELAAMTMMEIIKIRKRKTLTKVVITVCQNLLNTLESVQNASPLLKFLFPITFIGKIWGKAMDRLIFQECLIDVARAGMGEALKSGLIKSECCTLSEKKRKPPANQRPEYIKGEHWYDFIKAPLYNYVRAHEGAEYKQHWLVALVDIVRMDMGYFLSRLDADKLSSSEMSAVLSDTMNNENLKNLRFTLPEDIGYSKVEASVKESFDCHHGYYAAPENPDRVVRTYFDLQAYKARVAKDAANEAPDQDEGHSPSNRL